MFKFHYIYKTTNFITGEYYIGKHSGCLEDNYLGSGAGLKEGFKKYGRGAFKKEVISICSSEDEAFEEEAKMVTLETIKDPLCLNRCLGGGLGKI